jgi:hypothetical protein
MRKIIIPVALSILFPLMWSLLIMAFCQAPFDQADFIGLLRTCLILSALLWVSDFYHNGYTFRNPAAILKITQSKFDSLLSNKELVLENGQSIPLTVHSGKLFGFSPFNLLTFKSFFEIAQGKSENDTVELIVKVKSWSYIQVFDFGYNSKLLRSIEKALV